VHIVLFAELANYFPEEGETVPFLDAGMAAQNMLLAAHAMGLGAVFVKCTPRDLAAVPSSGEESSLPVFKARFNVPRSFIPVGVIGVGWPAARPKAPPRRGLQEVVCTEEFSPTRQNLGAVHRGSPAKRLVKRAFVRGAYAAGRRLGLRVFIASE